MANTDDTLSSRGTPFGAMIIGGLAPVGIPQSSVGLLTHSPKPVVAQQAGIGGPNSSQVVRVEAEPGPMLPENKIVYNDRSVNRDTVYRRPFYAASGRLISISHSTQAIREYLLGSEYISNSVVIYFPANPDSIELARSTDYKVNTSPFLPDGIHYYRATNPLEIPFSFSLSAFDKEYCTKGALSLLQIAARLHALTLPIGASDSGLASSAIGPSAQSTGDPSDSIKLHVVNSSTSTQLNSFKVPYMPVACILDLIYTGDESPGIRCMGYIKSVKVKLKQPFLQTQNTSHKNLPSAADFEFVFMHRPGYTNSFMNAENGSPMDLNIGINSMADDVKGGLYNNLGMLKRAVVTGQGFET